jgi:hypothetical protein
MIDRLHRLYGFAQRPGRPAAATRAVNNFALQALVAAFAAGKAIADERSARAVAEVSAESINKRAAP